MMYLPIVAMLRSALTSRHTVSRSSRPTGSHIQLLVLDHLLHLLHGLEVSEAVPDADDAIRLGREYPPDLLGAVHRVLPRNARRHGLLDEEVGVGEVLVDFEFEVVALARPTAVLRGRRDEDGPDVSERAASAASGNTGDGVGTGESTGDRGASFAGRPPPQPKPLTNPESELVEVEAGAGYPTSQPVASGHGNDAGWQHHGGWEETHLGDGAVPALTLSAYAAMDGRTTVWS